MQSTTNKAQLINPKDLFVASWKVYQRGFFHFIGMYLWGLVGVLPLAVVAATAVLLYTQAGWNNAFFYVIAGLLGLAALAWAIYYTTRAKIGWLVLIKNDFKDIKASFKETKPYFWTYLWASLITGLITFALVFFLVIPAIIVGVLYAFATFAIVFEGKRTFSSIERSYDLVKNYWWPVFGRFVLLGVVAMIVSVALNFPLDYLEGAAHDLLVFLINVFWALVGPFFLVYSYQLYLDLKSKN
ncbi:MAG: hypothetical protein Q8Q67_02955 [bacterium]|nr:hypothetical protein [bacterium]